MQGGPVGFDAAVASRSADTLTVQAVVATPGADVASASGWAESIIIERQMSGELPDSASDVVGGVSATATVNGDARADSAPSPLRDAASWLTSGIAVSAGYGGLTVPVFTGGVSKLDASEASGALRLDARDAADRLTQPARLRPWGTYRRRDGNREVWAHPTNTAGVVTSILHANGIRVTPAPRSSTCELSVPGVGGWLADVGWTYPFGPSRTSAWEVGRFGTAVAAQNADGTYEGVAGYLEHRRAFLGNSVMFEAFVNVTAAAFAGVLRLANYNGSSVGVDIASGILSVNWQGTSGGPSTLLSASITTGWHHVCVEVGAPAYAKLWIDGVAVASSTTVWAPTPTATDVDRITWGGYQVQAVAAYWRSGAINTGAAPTSAVASFAPEADVSTGAIDLASIPDVDGRGSWEVLQDIAQAELGMVGFSEAGRFFFKSRADLAASTAPVATWDTDLVDDVHPTVSVDSIITRATAKVATSMGVESGRGTLEVTPSLLADNVIQVPVGSTIVVLSADSPNMVDGQAVSLITAASGALNAPVWMTLCYDQTGITRYTGSDVSAWIRNSGVGSWELNIRNDSAFVLYAAWPSAFVSSADVLGLKAGDPGFGINGVTFEKATTVLVDRSNTAGVNAWGTRLHAFGDTSWRQDAAAAASFIDALLVDTSRARAQLADVTVPADPRWQIGDPIRLTDWSGRVPGIVARITSVRLTIDREAENGMVGTYGLRQIPGAAPRITSQPVDAAVASGATVTFTVTASAATAYRWQMRPVRGDWADIPGATAASYTTPALSVADSGRKYRCNVIGATGDDWSRHAIVTVSA